MRACVRDVREKRDVVSNPEENAWRFCQMTMQAVLTVDVRDS